MGCSLSKLDDEEAVQLCKDRKNFIKQAVEQRSRFALGHIAYIQSLKRVSAALRDYVDGDEPRQFLLDSYTTPTFTPIKKDSNSGFISISPNSFPRTPTKSSEPKSSSFKVHYMRPGGTHPANTVEERAPQSPEVGIVESHSPMHQFGFDGLFQMQSSPMNPSFFSYSPNNYRHDLPPLSPQPSSQPSSQWDYFWNPFSSLDYYGYSNGTSLNRTVMEEDIRGLRQVREEEGIPDLEEETEHDETDKGINRKEERGKNKMNSNCARDEVLVEDVDDEEDCDCWDDELLDNESENDHGMIDVVPEVRNAGQVGVRNQETKVSERETREETPGFTVYVNRRPTSMKEVIKDLEDHFTTICHAAKEVSAILEASSSQHSSTSNELSAMKMLNPVTLLRLASSRSSSSRFITNSSSSKDEGYESSSDLSEESCRLSGSHQSTLDRLCTWEKKLYQEVRCGERIRIAYDKKCMQFRNQDAKGDDPSAVDKTRMAIRDLHTQIKVSIHSVEAVSKRIETLRDEELQPQLLELVQGLSRMWKLMAECHQLQKRTLDEAKLLLASRGGTPSKLSKDYHTTILSTEPHTLARSAANLESELRNWRSCFESWITSQRSYVHALAGWLLRCIRCDETTKLPFSPRRCSGAPPIFSICIQWSRLIDEIPEIKVLEKLDFFAAGMGSLYAHQLREDSRRTPGGSRRYGHGFSNRYDGNHHMEVVEIGSHVVDEEEDEVTSREKMAEVAIKVMCAGMSVAVSSLTEFSIGSAEKYSDLVNQWENTRSPSVSVEN